MKAATRAVVALAVVAVGAPGVAPVFAQGAALEEVVVTARKRAESLEDSPVSVTAFTADQIESAGIATPADFVALTPNITLVQTQNAGNSFINIRGVSQARNSELSAAVLIDGVLMANPAQFNQQLFDIQQIEVLRGPQGALYGRNAIGGAITITTRQPTDVLEGKVELGLDNGFGYTVRGAVSGPVGIIPNLYFRASGSYVDTDGYIDNPYLGSEADPYEDKSGRIKLLWEPNENFSADLRFSYSELETQALYFNIAAEVDDTSLPVRVNNPGVNERDLLSASLKLEYESDFGTFTSITAYDYVDEMLTGDQFNFLPRSESWLNNDGIVFGPTIRAALPGDAIIDLSQTQYLETDAISQEFRYTSPAENRLRWIAGAYFIATDRFISTGNQVDRGNGVFPVTSIPRQSVFDAFSGIPVTDPSPQVGLLIDEQDNFAWAVFAEVAYDITDQLEASFSLRYDEDTRENTTLTQPQFDPTVVGLTTFGEVREETWDDLQPKFTLRWFPTEDITVYGGYSRGFRSGGFNQSGVGAAVPEPGVNDLFDAQTADTYEVGGKGSFLDGRLAASLSVYYTEFENAYFFFFDPATSTQNLGGIPETDYMGVEIEANARVTDYFSLNFGFGYTDSDIKKAADPADNGNQAPLVSEYTLNLGGLFRVPISPFGLNNAYAVLRTDYQRIGDTYWDPGNTSVRSPVDLVDIRGGIEVEGDWSLMLYAKNAFDTEYNAEFSPGPGLVPLGASPPQDNFLWKGAPRRWGVSFVKRF